jgi:hypothetical protein
MKTPPVNKTLRSYVDFDFDDNPPHIGELTLMFGQLAMCVNPWAGYGAMDRILWAVVGENFRFTCNEVVHGYQYARCIEVDPNQLTVTMDLFSTKNEFDEKDIVERKIFPVSEFRRFDVLFDKYIYDQCKQAMMEWLQEKKVAPMIVKSFEDTLYKLYKPGI